MRHSGAVHWKERKTKGWQYFQGICPQMIQSCSLWTLKSGIASNLSIRHQTRGTPKCGCGHTGRQAFREDPSPSVAKRSGVLSPGGILNKSPLRGIEQEMDYCSRDNKILLFWVKIIIIIPKCWERSKFQVWGCWETAMETGERLGPLF